MKWAFRTQLDLTPSSLFVYIGNFIFFVSIIIFLAVKHSVPTTLMMYNIQKIYYRVPYFCVYLSKNRLICQPSFFLVHIKNVS
jgi:hypothetical protein